MNKIGTQKIDTFLKQTLNVTNHIFHLHPVMKHNWMASWLFGVLSELWVLQNIIYAGTDMIGYGYM